MAGWRGAASGQATVRASEAVAAVFGDERLDRRHVPDLMTQRLRVVAIQRLLAMAAGCRFAVVDGVRVIDEGALDLGVSLLTARFVVGRRLGWGAFEGRRIGRRRLGGVGRILLETGFQIGKTLFVMLDEGKNSGLSSRWDLLP